MARIVPAEAWTTDPRPPSGPSGGGPGAAPAPEAPQEINPTPEPRGLVPSGARKVSQSH